MDTFIGFFAWLGAKMRVRRMTEHMENNELSFFFLMKRFIKSCVLQPAKDFIEMLLRKRAKWKRVETANQHVRICKTSIMYKKLGGGCC